MHRREEEDERHHRAFLLWAMQDPEQRSLRATARAAQCSDNSARKWRGKFGWEERVADPEHSRHAADLYAELYHTRLGGREVRLVEERMEVPYVPPMEEAKTEIAKANDLYEQVEREEARAAFVEKSHERTKKLRTVLDATLTRVGQGLASGAIKVKPSDVNMVIRGMQVIEEAEERRLAMLPSPEEDSTDSSDNVATSQRILQAQRHGHDILPALEEDAEELLLAVRTLRSHEQHSNVVPLPLRGGGDEQSASG